MKRPPHALTNSLTDLIYLAIFMQRSAWLQTPVYEWTVGSHVARLGDKGQMHFEGGLVGGV